MSENEIHQLSKIPYLDITNLEGRYVSTGIFHESGQWRMWIPTDDMLVEIKAWPSESFYFSAHAESEQDMYFHHLDFIAQRASFPNLRKPILGLHDDIFNLSASLAKITHLHSSRDAIGTGLGRMMVTEVEYIFSVCRSIFDLLQEIAHYLWERIQLHNQDISKKPLKLTFSKMVLYNGKVTTEELLTKRFGLPSQLAAYYVRHSKFFLTLREFRDNVIHRGSQVQHIFSSDDGFLVQHALKPFSDMNIWRDEEKQPNNLVPLLPALGVVINNTLAACEDFSTTIEALIQFPPPIAPGMMFLMRGYFNEIFINTLLDAQNRIS